MKHEVLLLDAVTPLLYWYQANKRDLPWRQNPTPYHVWISEIMLQQTRVEAVRGYYERFLSLFPDVASLAAADDDVLNKLWQGLGYYSRAKNLKKAANVIMEKHGGVLPRDCDALRALPGIGQYTAGAIASIAFGLPTPAVDGNVLRVVSRLCLSYDDIAKKETKDAITEALARVYRATPDNASALTQALMELGATVCIPNGAPRCELCPLADICLAHKEKCEETLPKKAPKKPRVIENRTVLLIRHGETYALVRRPEGGLLSGLWEFVSCDGTLSQDEVHTYLLEKGIVCGEIVPGIRAKHIFTHMEWHMTGYACEAADINNTEFVFATKDEIRDVYSVPSAYKAYLKFILSEV